MAEEFMRQKMSIKRKKRLIDMANRDITLSPNAQFLHETLMSIATA
jgi:hypothetical protein